MTLVLGTLNFGNIIKKKEAIRIISVFRDNSYKIIDTSPNYGKKLSEKILGEILIKNRKEFYIATKLGLELSKNSNIFNYKPILTKKYIINSVDRSLRNLNTDYIDLIQLHAFNDNNRIEEVIEILMNLKKTGKVNDIGCVNFNLSQINKFENIQKDFFSTVQIHYNFHERKAEKHLIDYCKNNKKEIFLNRIFGSGIFINDSNIIKKRMFSSIRLQKKYIKLKNQIDLIKTFCQKKSLDMVHFYLSWIHYSNFNKKIIIGISDQDQLNNIIYLYNDIIKKKTISKIEKSYINLFKSKCYQLPKTFHE
jgi:aryl-alcohol dehydrogenase-like predicted oxidoreductase